MSRVSPDPPGLPRGSGRAQHPLRDGGPLLPPARRHAAEEHVHHPRYHGNAPPRPRLHSDDLSKATYNKYISQKKRNNNLSLSVQ